MILAQVAHDALLRNLALARWWFGSQLYSSLCDLRQFKPPEHQFSYLWNGDNTYILVLQHKNPESWELTKHRAVRHSVTSLLLPHLLVEFCIQWPLGRKCVWSLPGRRELYSCFSSGGERQGGWVKEGQPSGGVDKSSLPAPSAAQRTHVHLPPPIPTSRNEQMVSE